MFAGKKKLKLKRSLRCYGKTKTNTIIFIARGAVIPIGRADVPWVVIKATSSADSVWAVRWALWIIDRAFSVVFFMISILYPFPYVARHVVNAQTVWFFQADVIGFTLRITIIPGILLQFRDIVSAGPFIV